MLFCSVPNCKSPNFSKDKLTGKGYCRVHQTQRTDFDRRTIIQKAIAKQGRLETKVRSLHSLPANKEMVSCKGFVKNNELELWFLARKHEMTGVCHEENCGNGTNKGDSKYYRWSCCHIVPKSLVPSVALHYANCIELCQLHHAEFDNTFERQSKMKCFELAKQKFQLFKHLIPPEEMRKVNPYLLGAVCPNYDVRNTN